ncbi:hypothetical protein EDC56_1821 [Sinobacterium caligoides]|uniref:Membrane transport protein MMPL domain-containing protein n=1 Tax=Sinobacterium caligoides TaxID=933926 RepID=A0A3N2DNL5_9GAMM|nr:MMPL family transporter [Sinobacterium caligoides]ROS01380.1 hypothetical protein EDC56_1821 [Sinobacterium caligoides]
MAATLIQRYDRTVLQRPLLTLVVVGALLVIAMLGLRHTEFDASADSLVLEGDKDLTYAREIGRLYQSQEFLMVTYQPSTPLYDDDTLARLHKLRDALLTVEGIDAVNSILDVPLLYSPKVSVTDLTGSLPTIESPNIDKRLVANEFAQSPIYKDLLVNQDHTVTVLQLNLRRDAHYFQLLQEREQLRLERREGVLSPEDATRLKAVETQFADYSLVVGARQQRLVSDVRALLDNYRSDATMFLGGVPMIAVDMINFVKGDLAVFGGAILFFIVVIMWIIFRAARWIVTPLLICSVSAASLLGLFGWLDWRLTVISSNLVAILLIVNLAILIHLIVRYRELQCSFPERSQRQLLLETVALMFKPCFYTTLTTLVAFASLVASGIRPVIDFGWMMCIGVGVALLLSFVLLPPILLLMGRRADAPSAGSSAPMTIRFAVMADHHGRAIAWLTLLALVVSVVGISQLKVENRFIDYFHEDTEIYRGMVTIDRELGGTIPLDVIIDASHEQLVLAGLVEGEVAPVTEAVANDDSASVDDEFDELFGDDFADEGDAFASDGDKHVGNVWFTVAGMRKITEVHDYLDALPETGKVLSLATLYEIMGDIMGNVDDIQLSLVHNKMPEAVQDALVTPFYNAEQHQARISLRIKEGSETLQRDKLLKKIHHDIVTQFDLEPEQVHLTGMLVLYNNMLQSLFRSQILTLAAVFVAITLMFLMLFRSLKLALIGVAPNMLVALLVLGGMGLLGIPLDMMTITIAAIGIGIGVDNNIHYIHRFKREFSDDGDYIAAMYRSHGSIGKAVFYTSTIIVIGFSVLVLSNFTPSIYFGLLTSFAMFAALMGALLLLPRLLIWFKPFGPDSRG